MADIQHKNITDPEIHEPKGIAATSADSIYISNGSGSGTWTNFQQLTGTGWVRYVDSVASKSITATGSPGTVLTIDKAGAGGIETYAPPNLPASLWDATTNKLKPAAVGDAYAVVLKFTVNTANAVDYITIELDNGTATRLGEQVNPLPAVAGEVLTVNFAIFTDTDTFNNGVIFKAYKNAGATLTLSDLSISIARIHKG